MLRDWSIGAVGKQSDLAVDAPDVPAFAASAAEQTGRTDRVDMAKVLAAIGRVLAGQMDAYAHGLSSVDASQVARMRDILYGRPDFRYEMLFDGLTYFGPDGVAMCNSLVEQLDAFYPQLVELIAGGNFDRD